jgi:hypothetical protein
MERYNEPLLPLCINRISSCKMGTLQRDKHQDLLLASAEKR